MERKTHSQTPLLFHFKTYIGLSWISNLHVFFTPGVYEARLRRISDTIRKGQIQKFIKKKTNVNYINNKT